MKRIRNLRFFAILTVVCVFGLLITVPAARGQTIAIPSYTVPGSKTWKTWAAYPQSAKIMIINLNNGDDTAYHPNVQAAVQAAQASGITVLGYTYTQWGKRNPAVVEQVIQSERSNYNVDGIFLDQAPTSCTDRTPFGETTYQYYQNLYTYIHAAGGTGITVLNPGTQPFTDCWMNVTDILVNWENSGISNYQHKYVNASWVYNYSSSRFWHLLYSVSRQSDMVTAFNLARTRNAGWIYVTNDGADGNPWDNVPSYWNAEAALK